jgi:hypothetical protein
MGFDGCWLVGELVLPLGGPALDVNVSSAGLCSLLLLIGMRVLGEEFGTWLWCSGPQWDRRDGQKCQSILRR